MSDFVGFDGPTADRILAATRSAEANPFGLQFQQSQIPLGALTRQTVIFRVLNVTPAQGFWQAKWQYADLQSTGTPAITFDESASELGWAYGLNDGTLQQDQLFFGQLVGIKPDDNRAVFIANTVSVVAVKCTNVTPTNVGGRFIFPGQIQNFRVSNLTFNDAKLCWIHDMNNVQALALNNIYLGLINGKHTDGIPLVLISDFNLSYTDAHTATTYDRVRRINWSSTPTTYNASKGDIVETFDPVTRVLTLRMNGFTGIKSPVYACSAGNFQYKDEDVRNGLTKTVSALHG